MPKFVERKLREKAKEKFPGDKKRQDAYVYGALRDMGWKPEQEKRKQKRRGGGRRKR